MRSATPLMKLTISLWLFVPSHYQTSPLNVSRHTTPTSGTGHHESIAALPLLCAHRVSGCGLLQIMALPVPSENPLPKTELLKLTTGTAAGTCYGTEVIPPIDL